MMQIQSLALNGCIFFKNKSHQSCIDISYIKKQQKNNNETPT